MRLIHFSHAGTLTVESRAQERPDHKPRGLWLSDESDGSYGWRSWCTDEEYGLGKNVFEVTLAESANVLTLSTVEDVREFDARFASKGDRYYRHRCFIDWQRVATYWQGILITPYQWKLRLSDVGWYYTWDCASGCIWDAAAVASVTTAAHEAAAS